MSCGYGLPLLAVVVLRVPTGTADSGSDDLPAAGGSAPGFLRALDVPAPPASADRDPAPAVVFVAFNGHTLDPCEPPGEAGRNCSPLVQRRTIFPAWGTVAQRAEAIAALSSAYAPFDLIFRTEAPPPYLPHALVVVGGSTSLLGKTSPSCGVAWLTCGATHRRGVALVFASHCGSTARMIAASAAQEIAHTLGLEHTNDATDLMFPSATQLGERFQDACLPIVPSDEARGSKCPDEHRVDCPEGPGVRENPHAELLRGLGPARIDDAAPRLVAHHPAFDRPRFVGQPFETWFELEDQAPTIGVRITLVAAPEGAGLEAPWSRCTNDACPWTYPEGLLASGRWPFAEITPPIAGTYQLALEAIDPHGNRLQQTFNLEVRDREDEGCGCRTPSDGREPAPWSLALTLAAAGALFARTARPTRAAASERRTPSTSPRARPSRRPSPAETARHPFARA